MDKLLPHQNLSLEDMEGEIWKDIESYDGYYQISNFGRVKSLNREIIRSDGKKNKYKGRILKSHISKRGYYIVDIHINNLRKTYNIHRLIAINFISNPSNKKQVNHIDSNPLNNSINNLEWVNNLENTCHRSKKYKYSSKYIGVGWDKYNNKWKCQIYFNGKSKHIGVFNTEEEAYQARCEYEKNNNIENKYL
jgi:hypothetical protein